MNRIVTVTIDKKDYPLLFSILAMEEIYDVYGSLEDMITIVFSSKNIAKQLKEVLKIIWILNKAAVAYYKAKKQETENINLDELITSINPYDAINLNLWETALETINKGSSQTVEVASNSKNAEATQG